MSTRLSEAIGKYESGGNYNAIGPTTAKGNKAYGKYQIMDFNIPYWTKEALGTALSTEQFLNDPKAQDATARYKIGQYYEKYKNVADVASLWFSGRPVNAAGEAKDVLGTSVPQYVKNVESIYEKTQNPLFENFNVKVDKSRELGLTDTDILNRLADKDPEIKEKLNKTRNELKMNDRDILNSLSVKYSGKMPSVQSVALKTEQPVEKKAEEKKSVLGKIFEPYIETAKDIFGTIKGAGEDVEKRYKELETVYQKTKKGEITPATTGLQVAGKVAGLFQDIAGRIFTGFIKLGLEQEDEQKLVNGFSKVLVDTGAASALKKGQEEWGKVKEKYPDFAGNVESLANLGLSVVDVVGFGASGAASKTSKNAIKNTLNETMKLSKSIKETGFEVSKKIGQRAETKLGSHLENLNPKNYDAAVKSGVNSYKTGLVGDLVSVNKNLDKLALRTKTTVTGLLTNLVKAGIFPEVKGKLAKFTNSFKELAEKSKFYVKTIDGVVPKFKQTTKLDDFIQNIYDDVMEYGSPALLEKTLKSLERLKSSYKLKYGNILTAEHLHVIRKEANELTKAFKTEIYDEDLFSSVGNIARKRLDEILPNAYKESNKAIQDIMNLEKTIKIFDNQKIRINELAEQFGRYAGTISGGLILGGAVSGAGTLVIAGIFAKLGADVVANILRKVKFNKKAMEIIREAMKKEPSVLYKLLNEASKEDLKTLQLLLPAGKTEIPTTYGNRTIELPSPKGKGEILKTTGTPKIKTSGKLY